MCWSFCALSGTTKILSLLNTNLESTFFIMYQGSLEQEKVRYINCLYELCVSTIHILLPLYFGNEMILKMRSILLALHESNWVEQSQGFRKIMVIFLVIKMFRHSAETKLIATIAFFRKFRKILRNLDSFLWHTLFRGILKLLLR